MDHPKAPYDEAETDNVSGQSITANELYRPDVDTSGVDERKLLRRIDIYILPWLAFLYVLNFLDRGSIGNAKVRLFPSPSLRN